MIRAALIGLLAAVIAPSPPGAAAQERGAQTARTEAPRPAIRLRQTTEEPFRLGAPLPRARPDIAPIPDRSIEAPRAASSYRDPTLEPMILQPERRHGATFGREHLRETGPDRPFDNILPGARLRIPIE